MWTLQADNLKIALGNLTPSNEKVPFRRVSKKHYCFITSLCLSYSFTNYQTRVHTSKTSSSLNLDEKI
jgi:hypothetical protein